MEPDEMCKQNGLLQRGTTFYFQARIPKDCLKHFPKPVIRDKLTATTHAEAKAQVRQRWADLEAIIARIRTTGSPHKLTLKPEDADNILAAYTASRLEAHETDRLAGLDANGFEQAVEAVTYLDAAERNVAAKGDIRGVQERAADWLRGYGYSIPMDSPEFRSFAMRFAKAGQPLTQALLKQQRGEFVELPQAAPQAAPKETEKAPSNVPMLSVVVNYFLDNYADKQRPMYRKYAAVLPVFLQSAGDKPVDQLKQMDIEDFCKMICRLPTRWRDDVRRRKISVMELAKLDHPKTIAPKTFEDTYVASLRPFLSSSRRIFGDAGFPGHLTTDGIIYRGLVKAGENAQRAFTPDELKTLVAKLKPFAKVPSEVHQSWLPLVALHTGARVNEICQCNPQTDIDIAHSVPHFYFTEETEGDSRIRKSIKNASSKRKVPIHSALIKAGFLDYVKAIRDSGAKLLFPQWEPGNKGKASHNAEKWFIDFLKETGLRDETPGKRIVGFHAFRSTFLNRALNLRIPDAETITGHAGEKSTVVRGYEGELALEHKRDIIERVTFDIAIPHPAPPKKQ